MSSKKIIYDELLQTNLLKRKMNKKFEQALYNGRFLSGNVFDLISQKDMFGLS